eukprot:scaffold42802_cov31-Tisochrysis_lutea.AAC.9
MTIPSRRSSLASRRPSKPPPPLVEGGRHRRPAARAAASSAFSAVERARACSSSAPFVRSNSMLTAARAVGVEAERRRSNDVSASAACGGKGSH